jgi:hypothetical protein
MSAYALDTNLLLVLVVGTATGGVAGKRLKSFTLDDLQTLQTCLSDCGRLVVKPNVWTEVSNIWDFGMEAEWHRTIPIVLANMINGSIELIHPSKDVIHDPEFATRRERRAWPASRLTI